MRTTEPGAALKAWRTMKGMSQEQLASVLGVDQSYVSLLESGKVEPRASIGEHLRRMTKGAVIWAPDELPVPHTDLLRKVRA